MIADMTVENIGALVVAVLLTAYLVFALLFPDKI